MLTRLAQRLVGEDRHQQSLQLQESLQRHGAAAVWGLPVDGKSCSARECWCHISTFFFKHLQDTTKAGAHASWQTLQAWLRERIITFSLALVVDESCEALLTGQASSWQVHR
jgi:hypothetical protein